MGAITDDDRAPRMPYECFYCGEKLHESKEDTIVFWQGNDSEGDQIWMHQLCAYRLGKNLIKDSGL